MVCQIVFGPQTSWVAALVSAAALYKLRASVLASNDFEAAWTRSEKQSESEFYQREIVDEQKDFAANEATDGDGASKPPVVGNAAKRAWNVKDTKRAKVLVQSPLLGSPAVESDLSEQLHHSRLYRIGGYNTSNRIPAKVFQVLNSFKKGERLPGFLQTCDRGKGSGRFAVQASSVHLTNLMNLAQHMDHLPVHVRVAMSKLAMAVAHLGSNPQQRWGKGSPCVYCHVYECEGETRVCYLMKSGFEDCTWHEFLAHFDVKEGSELFLVTINIGDDEEGEDGGARIHGATEVGFGHRSGSTSASVDGRCPLALVAKNTGAVTTLSRQLCRGNLKAVTKFVKAHAGFGEMEVPAGSVGYHASANLHRVKGDAGCTAAYLERHMHFS
jgi:hypothetical protein